MLRGVWGGSCSREFLLSYAIVWCNNALVLEYLIWPSFTDLCRNQYRTSNRWKLVPAYPDQGFSDLPLGTFETPLTLSLSTLVNHWPEGTQVSARGNLASNRVANHHSLYINEQMRRESLIVHLACVGSTDMIEGQQIGRRERNQNSQKAKYPPAIRPLGH